MQTKTKTEEQSRTRVLRYGKFGLAEDPRHLHCTLRYQGRVLLGEIMSAGYCDIRSGCFLTVRHFNGEPWPINPSAGAVRVLIREYEAEEEPISS